MTDKNFNEKESLALITAMIHRTRERYMLGDGNILLMWGYLTVIVTALVWLVLLLTRSPMANWLWFLIWIVGGIATPLMSRKKQIEKGMKSYSDKLCSGIWTAVGIIGLVATLFCLAFSLFGGPDCWRAMFVFALVVVPFAEIVQGIIIGEKSFIGGGAVGLAVGIATVCLIAGEVMLVASWFLPMFMLAFVSMMIVPGYVLNYKARKQNERA